jgi:hypothetical protein
LVGACVVQCGRCSREPGSTQVGPLCGFAGEDDRVSPFAIVHDKNRIAKAALDAINLRLQLWVVGMQVRDKNATGAQGLAAVIVKALRTQPAWQTVTKEPVDDQYAVPMCPVTDKQCSVVKDNLESTVVCRHMKGVSHRNHVRIDLDYPDVCMRQMAIAELGNGSPTKSNDRNVDRCRIKEEKPHHEARVLQVQKKWILQPHSALDISRREVKRSGHCAVMYRRFQMEFRRQSNGHVDGRGTGCGRQPDGLAIDANQMAWLSTPARWPGYRWNMQMVVVRTSAGSIFIFTTREGKTPDQP